MEYRPTLRSRPRSTELVRVPQASQETPRDCRTRPKRTRRAWKNWSKKDNLSKLRRSAASKTRPTATSRKFTPDNSRKTTYLRNIRTRTSLAQSRNRDRPGLCESPAVSTASFGRASLRHPSRALLATSRDHRERSALTFHPPLCRSRHPLDLVLARHVPVCALQS